MIEMTEAIFVQLRSDNDGLGRFFEWMKDNPPMQSFSSGRGNYSGLWLPEDATALMEFAEQSGEDVLVTIWGRDVEGDSALDERDRITQPNRPYGRQHARVLRRDLGEG
jgi:hypothetical protein